MEQELKGICRCCYREREIEGAGMCFKCDELNFEAQQETAREMAELRRDEENGK